MMKKWRLKNGVLKKIVDLGGKIGAGNFSKKAREFGFIFWSAPLEENMTTIPKKVSTGVKKTSKGKTPASSPAEPQVMLCLCKEPLVCKTSKAGLEYYCCSIRKWSPDTGADGGCNSWFKKADIDSKQAKPCKDCHVVSKWPCKCKVVKHPLVVEAEKQEIHCYCDDGKQLAGCYVAHKGQDNERVFANCKKRENGNPKCKFWTWVELQQDLAEATEDENE